MVIIGSNNASGVGELGLKENISTLLKRHPNLIIEEVIEDEIPTESTHPQLKRLEAVVHHNQKLAEVCQSHLQENHFVLNIIGDHSASIGTVSASASQAQNLGLIWIDAHPDLNTDETSPSGNIHGMSVAALLNLFDSPLNDVLYPGPKVSTDHIVYIGLRSIDPGELQALQSLNIKYFEYETMLELGFYEVLTETINHLIKCDKVHISVDMDSMDPQGIPGVSVPVDAGFSLDEVEDLLQNLRRHLPVIAMDITEYNPAYDRESITVDAVYELIESIGEFHETRS